MVVYPDQLDTSSTLPKIVDSQTYVNAAAVNPFRDAILAIENELGANPSGTYGSVKDRFNILEDKFNLISSLESKIEELEELVNSSNSEEILENIESLQEEINSISDDLESLDARFESYKNSNNISISNINEDISNIDSEILNIQSQINSLDIPESLNILVNSVQVATDVSILDFIGDGVTYNVIDGYKVELTFTSGSGGGSEIYFDNFGAIPAADSEAIKLQIATSTSPQTYSAANLDGAIGAGTMFPARSITVSQTSQLGAYAGTVTINGKDIDDNVISEVITLFVNGNSELKTWKAFKQITSIEVSAQNNTNGFLSFGTNNRIGFSKLSKNATTIVPLLQLYASGAVETVFQTFGTSFSLPYGIIEFTNIFPDSFTEFLAIYVLDI